MSNNWSKVKLGDVLEHRQEFVTIDDLKNYRRPRVRLHAQGIVLRDEVPGALIKTKDQQICRAGEFLVAEIDAKVGGYGIVPESLEGSIVSSHYFLFIPDRTKLDRGFLDYFLRTPAFGDQVAAQGSTNYAAIRPSHVLNYEIPLPPLMEQRRIVARIEESATRIEEARGLRKQVLPEAEALFGAVLDRVTHQLGKSFPSKKLVDLVERHRGISYGVVLTGSHLEDGIPTLRAGNLQRFQVLLDGVKKIDPAVEAKYNRTRLRGNELLLRIRGGLGEVAVCPAEMIGGNVSREIAVIPFTDELLPRYGMYILSSPVNQERMVSHLRGTAYLGINLHDVRTLSLPVPPLPAQEQVLSRLEAVQSIISELKQSQSETSVELDALMPSILDKAFRGEL